MWNTTRYYSTIPKIDNACPPNTAKRWKSYRTGLRADNPSTAGNERDNGRFRRCMLRLNNTVFCKRYHENTET